MARLMKSFSIGFILLISLSAYSFIEYQQAYVKFNQLSASLSGWGVTTPLPFKSLERMDSSTANTIKSAYNLEAVMTVLTKKFPRRGSMTYLGEHQGEFLFSTSKHLELKDVFAVVNFHQVAEKNRVEYDGAEPVLNAIKLIERPIYEDVEGDVAIYKVDQDAMESMDQYKDYKDYKEDLRAISAPPFFNGNYQNLLDDPGVTAVVAGRAIIGYRNVLSGKGVWNDNAEDYWSFELITDEAKANGGGDKVSREALGLGKFPMPSDLGDVFVVAATNILAQPQLILDPDGAPAIKAAALDTETDPEKMVKNGSFSPVSSNWKVMSIPLSNYIMGRMSGSPVLVRYFDPQDATEKVIIAGLSWTGSNQKPLSDEPSAVFPIVEWVTAEMGVCAEEEFRLTSEVSEFCPSLPIFKLDQPYHGQGGAPYVKNKDFSAISFASASTAIISGIKNYLNTKDRDFGNTQSDDSALQGLVDASVQ